MLVSVCTVRTPAFLGIVLNVLYRYWLLARLVMTPILFSVMTERLCVNVFVYYIVLYVLVCICAYVHMCENEFVCVYSKYIRISRYYIERTDSTGSQRQKDENYIHRAETQIHPSAPLWQSVYAWELTYVRLILILIGWPFGAITKCLPVRIITRKDNNAMKIRLE
jgi:hypothetical protein